MDFVSCRDRQQAATHKLVALRLRGTDNSRPWGLLLPLATVTLTDMARSLSQIWPDCCQHLTPFTHTLGNYLWALSSTKPREARLPSPPASSPAVSLPPVFYLVCFPSPPSFRSGKPLTSGEGRREGLEGLPVLPARAEGGAGRAERWEATTHSSQPCWLRKLHRNEAQ